MPKVLGNDPFLRGAPARPETEIKTTPAPAPATPARAPVRPAKPKKPPRPAAAAQPAAPRNAAPWPKAADKNAPARVSVRTLMSKPEHDPVLVTPPARLADWEPTSHPGSPQMVVLVDGVATPHSGSPELVAQLNAPPDRLKQFVAHAHSPEVLSLVGREAVSHAHSPEIQAVLRASAPQPHPHHGSPEVQAVLRASAPQPHPHQGSPEVVVELRPSAPEPHPHHGSPEVVAELRPSRPEPHPHRGSPTVVAELDEGSPVPHPLSPEVVEVRAAGGHRPVVVEIVEPDQTRPEPPMSDREISPSPRASGPALALAAAADVFSGGVRPLAGAAQGLFQAARTALGIGGGAELDVWGKDLSLTRSLEPLSDFLYDKYFRVTVEGADHLPSGASILVANHSGALPLDGPMLYLALRRERADLPDLRWLMEDQVFHAPFIGVLANRLGAVRASPENATRLLEEQRPVAVFPEGLQGISKPYGDRYHLKRFGRGGYVKLAVRLNVPIVPVAIVGAEESMPLLAKLPGGLFGLPYLPLTVPPLPAKWHIQFGAPVDLSDVPAGGEEDLAWVAHTNDRVREQIEGMLTAMLRGRTSVF